MTQDTPDIGATLELPLTNGLVTLVDAEDYQWLSGFKWYAKKRVRKGAEPCYYAARSVWHNGRSRTVRMHRLIMGAKGKKDVDHRNGNGLDNRKENLRLCTRAENTRASHVGRGGNNPYKGVTYDGSLTFKPWSANIVADRRRTFLGNFHTAEEAAVAYDLAAIELHGDFTIPSILSIDFLREFQKKALDREEKLRIAVEAMQKALNIDEPFPITILEQALSQIHSLSPHETK